MAVALIETATNKSPMSPAADQICTGCALSRGLIGLILRASKSYQKQSLEAQSNSKILVPAHDLRVGEVECYIRTMPPCFSGEFEASNFKSGHYEAFGCIANSDFFRYLNTSRMNQFLKKSSNNWFTLCASSCCSQWVASGK